MDMCQEFCIFFISSELRLSVYRRDFCSIWCTKHFILVSKAIVIKPPSTSTVRNLPHDIGGDGQAVADADRMVVGYGGVAPPFPCVPPNKIGRADLKPFDEFGIPKILPSNSNFSWNRNTVSPGANIVEYFHSFWHNFLSPPTTHIPTSDGPRNFIQINFK